MPGVKRSRRRPATTITYRAPFSVMGNNVIDGLGLIVAQFSTSEQILISRVARDAAVVVAKALNDITAEEVPNG